MSFSFESYNSQASQNTRTPKKFLKKCSHKLWNEDEDRYVTSMMLRPRPPPWTDIARCLTNKTATQVARRWQTVLDPRLTKGGWTVAEDERLRAWIADHGETRWCELARVMPGRTGKQCRERWVNHLKPAPKKQPWTEDEDRRLLQIREELGNRWKDISTRLGTSRTENEVKNRWYSTLSRRLDRERRGEEPIHKRGRKAKPRVLIVDSTTPFDCLSPTGLFSSADSRDCDELFETDLGLPPSPWLNFD